MNNTNPIIEKDGKFFRHCNKCDTDKEILQFNKNKRNTNGLSDYCKDCNNKYSVLYRKSNKEICNERVKRWKRKHQDKVIKWRRAYQISDQNKNKRNEKLKTRRKTDVGFNIRYNLSRRIRQALKSTNTRKTNPTLKLLGCTIQELKKHLENQFKNGMKWDNYGKWHIDHIKPCASFDLTKDDDQKKCFHYTNLQPLWMLENIKKSDKIIDNIV